MGACSSSAPTAPPTTAIPTTANATVASETTSRATAASETTDGPTSAELWSRITVFDSLDSSTAVGTEAVIDGFRVHPDPEDGVIHVVSGGQRVVVNGTDIKATGPDAQSYLVVNWGDGPNQRVGCGPCRADHDYAPGRYTLVASLDGTDRDRSISIQVQVSAPREKPEAPQTTPRFQTFGFVPETLAFRGTGFLVTPFPLPSGITELSLDCHPLLTILPNLAGRPQVFPGGLGIPIFASRRGTCTFTIAGSDAQGPYRQTSTLTVQ